MVELARPLGNLMSRLAAAQTNFISEVLGARIAAGLVAEDPTCPTGSLPKLSSRPKNCYRCSRLTTLYAWRRHLAAEVGRALFQRDRHRGRYREPAGRGGVHRHDRIHAVVRNVELTDLASLLDRFETVVLDAVVQHGGRVIKNLGDEILFVMEDPVSAAEATLQLLDDFAADDSCRQCMQAWRSGRCCTAAVTSTVPW